MVFNIVFILLEIIFVVGLFLFQFGVFFVLIIVVSVVVYIGFLMKVMDWCICFVIQMNEVDLIINFWVVDSLLNFEIVKYFNNEFFEVNCYDMDLVVWEKV